MRRRPELSGWPLTAPFLLGLLVILGGVIVLIQVGVLTYAYQRLGLSRDWAFALLIGSVIGSRINIPVARWPEHLQDTRRVVTFFGVSYLVPVRERVQETTLAVNIGGACIPAGLSVYLVLHDHLGWAALWATLAVVGVVYLVARPVEGLGIAVPTLLPPLAAVGAAALSGAHLLPATAYVAGTLGALVGADLLNLGRIRGLGAPLASIGGAGTFDGIFLTGVLAVVLAGL